MKTTTVIAGACKICYPPAPKLQTKLIECKKFSYIHDCASLIPSTVPWNKEENWQILNLVKVSATENPQRWK